MAFPIDSFPGRTLHKEGETYLYFGGTAYLGLQLDSEFQSIFINNLKKFGTNYGASRKSNVQLGIFEAVEKYLANIVGSEACITLSSGYLAGQLVMKSFRSNAHQFFYAPNTHSALYHQGATTFSTFAELNVTLRKHLALKQHKAPVVFLDTIDFAGRNYPDFKALQSLPLDQIILVADDSHGLGIVGPQGRGAYFYLKNLKPKELIVCSSLGKGYGIQAGAIFGLEQRIMALKETELFGGAGPAAPVGLATLMDSHEIYHKKRMILKENIGFFLARLSNDKGFEFNSEHPAFSFSNESLVAGLERNKIVITNFRYPNETSDLKSRIVLTASHKKEDIQYLVRHLNTLL